MASESNTTSSRFSLLARICLSAWRLPRSGSALLYLSRTPAVQADDPASPAPAPAPKEPTAEFFPALSKAEETILAALAKPTTLDFQSTPLEKAVAYLKDLHKIEIQLDTKALEDAGQGTDTPVTRKLSGLSLRSGLRLMLGSFDLTYIIKDEVLLITTKEVAEAELVTRTYPVGDLSDEGDYDSLVEAITSTAKPQTWNKVGGPAQIAVVESCASLVISQTQDMHDEVLQLLRSLRAARKAGGLASGVTSGKATSSAKAKSKRRLAKGGKVMGGMGGGMMGGMGGGQKCTGGGKGKGGGMGMM